jgi:hypothetical protein
VAVHCRRADREYVRHSFFRASLFPIDKRPVILNGFVTARAEPGPDAGGLTRAQPLDAELNQSRLLLLGTYKPMGCKLRYASFRCNKCYDILMIVAQHTRRC